MSDARTPESVTPATTPVEPVVVPEPAPTVVAEPAPAAEPVAVAAPVEAAPVVVEKKRRGIGAWSFVLGLLTALVDVALLVLGIVALVGVASAAMSGDIQAMSTVIAGAGLVFLVLLVFFGGLLTGGVAALLGLIALISGRGRVLGLFGLIFGAAAVIVRVLILSAGFSPDLG